MRHLTTTTVFFVLLASFASAQSHQRGTWQFSLGASLGVHATHYEKSYSYTLFGQDISFDDEADDAAATTTFPIEVDYGLADRFSLGLYVEPGRYLDSADNNPNSIFLIGLSPHFYLINKDRFNLSGILDVGAGALRISDKEETVTDTYAGGHFRLGLGASFYFGDHFGLQVFGKYGAYSLKWRDREPDPNVDNFEATLRTSGLHIGAGVTFKL